MPLSFPPLPTFPLSYLLPTKNQEQRTKNSRAPLGTNTMNIMKMMQQAQEMQQKMQTAQESLAKQEVEASVGGGKVTVKGTAAGEITSIKIDPSVIDPDDVEMLEDLVLSGVKQAIEEGRKVMADEMSKVTGGMNLPPGMGL